MIEVDVVIFASVPMDIALGFLVVAVVIRIIKWITHILP
jgi:hypothetical protein